MEDNLITRNHERVKSFFEALDRMLAHIESLTRNYCPTLRGERFLTDKEVSLRLKVSRRTLQEYRTHGRIPYIQLGGKIIYRESDIQKMLEDGYRGALK